MMRFATALLSASLAGGAALLAPAVAAEGDSCLRPHSVDGFVEATPSSVVLTEGARRWKADMAGACTDLDRARGLIAVAGGACLKAGDKVQYRDRLGGQRRCKIATLTYEAAGGAPAP